MFGYQLFVLYVLFTFTTHLSGRQRKYKFSIKSPGSSEGWIDCINPIGCSNDDYLPSVVETIHESKECGDNGRVDLVLTTGTNRGQPVNLVKEDDGGTHLVCLRKAVEIVQYYYYISVQQGISMLIQQIYMTVKVHCLPSTE